MPPITLYVTSLVVGGSSATVLLAETGDSLLAEDGNTILVE